MSLKSFLNKIANFFANIFNKLLPELQNAVHIGVTITEAIKTFDTKNGVIVDILTAIIPGDVDDLIKTKLREALPKIVVELKLVDATLGLTDPAEIMAAAVKVIQGLDGNTNSAFLHSFSVLAAQVAADGKLDFGDGVYLLQWYYDHKK
ncbi:MAG: hypothetical protein H7320_13155 [Ferruginibacter sp.]|nr:hypothetical protein [Ferruginibacter sp.]